MRKPVSRRSALALISAGFVTHAQGDAPDPAVKIDDRGRSVRLGAARRIACIGGLITEVVYAVGESKRICAVDLTATSPKEALREKKNLGYMRSISAEGVLSVKPDLILAMDDSGPAAAFASLGQSGIPLFYISSEASPHAALNRITTIAGLVDQASKGKTLRDSVARGFEKVDRAARATRVHPKVLFVLHMANNRLICGGAGSPAGKVLSICGARNVASAFQGYKMFNPEELAVLQPDIVVTMQENGSAVHDVLIENAGFRMTPAGRKNQLVAVNGEALLTFGPRTPDAMLDLIHRFTDLMADT